MENNASLCPKQRQQLYYYLVVNRNGFIVSGPEFPMYKLKRVADGISDEHPGSTVVQIKASLIHDVINTHGIKLTRKEY